MSVVGALSIACALVYFVFPGVLLSAMQSAAVWSSGLTAKSVAIDGYSAHYYEGGDPDGETVVLLHGLIDDRNSYVASVSTLTETYRVILPDLQGHGDNTQVEGRDYSIRGQAAFVASLLERLELGSVHLGGNSMGGHVAAAVALHYPDKVQKLILSNATGMLLDRESTYFYFPREVDTDFMNELFGRFFVEPPTFPPAILDHLADDLSEKAPFFNRLVAQVEAGSDFRLDERVENIIAPTLVLWGDADPLLPTDYAQAFHSKLPNSELRIIRGGHSPQLESPEKVQEEILGFLRQEEATDS